MTSSPHHPILLLASASPRRAELLALAGIPFVSAPANICEELLPGELPADHVTRLSEAKAREARCHASGSHVVGADTVVVLDGVIMGKPAEKGEAFAMLSALSGRTHQVLTGFTVLESIHGITISRVVTTEVTFRALTEAEITAYIATGCPFDKAGAYAIQGGAVHFVQSINGSYSNVVGLPMAELWETLVTLGFPLTGCAAQ